MKVRDRVLEAEGNLGGERVGMTIDQSALSHIMSVLTDLYSDPELAVIREYSTNALDANIEAGVKRPIEITLPTALSPFFKVRDHGIGLNAEDIREIYSRYGTSTKRNSDDVVGMLGLGCKSALTYTDQFTLTSHKDGKMTTVAISRDEDGGGSMTIVSEGTPTSEQGTEIIVPVKRGNMFEGKSREFFRFWDEGTVLVNGEQPKRIDGLWVTDKLLLTREVTRDFVVMGNVAYPWVDPEYRYGQRYGQQHHKVAFVNIGDVQFTPSREALQNTKHTRETLARLQADFERETHRSLQAQAENAATPQDAMKLAVEGQYLGVKNLTYKGKIIPFQFKRALQPLGSKVPQERMFRVVHLNNNYRSYGRKSGDEVGSVAVKDTLFFTGYTAGEVSPHKRAKLEVYFKGQLPGQTCCFIDKLSADEVFWLAPGQLHDWAKVEEIKITKDTSITVGNGRPRGSYRGRKDGRWSESIKADEIDTSKPLFYLQGNSYEARSSREMQLGMISDDATVIALQANRVEKFKRDFSMAQEMQTYARMTANDWLKSLDKRVKEAALLQKAMCGTAYKNLDHVQIDDPELSEFILKLNMNVASTVNKLSNWRWFFDGDPVGVTRISNPFDKYPLAGPYLGIHSRPHPHIYTYLNAAYAAGKEAQ